MIRSTRTLAAISVALLAAGCANTTFHVPFFGSDDKPKTPEYAEARKEIQNRPLEVPPDLNAPQTSAAYSIPGLNGVALSAAGQKALEAGTVLPKFDRIRLETDGREKWLVVNGSAEAVWPQARQFWLDQGFKLTVDSPTAGLLETDWLEERPDLPVGGIRAALARGLGTLYSSGRVDQYRMRFERSADAKSTEIFITHRVMEESYIGSNREDTRWLPKPADPEREATMLKKLLVRIGVGADAAAPVVASVTAKGTDAVVVSAGVAGRATVVTVDGKRAIQLDESFDRAWRRVGLAIERAGYSINDRDRSKGIYFVRPGIIQKAKEEGGFWSKLAFWKSDEKKAEEANKGPEYMVTVVGKDGHTNVASDAKTGSGAQEAVAKTLFESLLTELR